MLGDSKGLEPGVELACDVCIIGAGPAGITIARELMATQVDVILLESGGPGLEGAVRDLTAGELAGAPQYPLHASRLRMLGGTTGHWGGMCRPLDELDFAPRPWIPNSGWPLTRSDLDPHYARAHAICELGPYDYGASAWRKLFLRRKALAGLGTELKVLQLSPPTRFGTRYRRELARSPSTRVFLHSTVTEIVPDEGARTIERAEVRSLDGQHYSVRARTFVLACGGLENARLLLLSNRVVPAGVGNERDLVGRYFIDHPAVHPLGTLLLFGPKAHKLEQKQLLGKTDVLVGLGLSADAQREDESLNSVLYVAAPAPEESAEEVPEPDLRAMSFLYEANQAPPPMQFAQCWLRSEQVPNAASRVTLGESLDALGQRRLRLDWQLTELDLRSLQRSARRFVRALGAAGLGRLKQEPWLEDPESPWWQNIVAGWHHMGTTRMADDPARGVVDRSCRVHGLDNLYIAGSSVFPTGGFANPTLTLVALATRLADHLKDRRG